jgi:hypothetical protein
MLQNCAGSTYYPLSQEPKTTIKEPPVILQSGTAGTSTIYMNNTSAKVRVQPSWYNPSWDYRKKITVNHTRVQANSTAFPVLISLTSDNDLASHAQSNGNDILFTSSDGVTKLSHEIEKYTSSTGELVAWVKVPSLSSLVDTDLYMYYGNPTCGSQQDATNVWDSNFKGVYHLQGDPTTPTPNDWGKTNIGSSSTTSSHSRAMGGTSPNVDNMKIKSISVYLGAQTGNVRLAIYTGGQLDNPTSATLLWDAGTVNPYGVAGWYTINHPSGGVPWAKNTVTWLAWKRNTAVAVYYHTTSSEAGNFQTARGRNDNTFSQDPGVAFPSTYGQQGTFTNNWYSIHVDYEVITLMDSTSNRNYATSSGSMTSADQVTGKIDGSLDFDGSNDELQCGNDASLQITTAVTVEAWVKRPSTAAIYAGIAGKCVAGGGSNYKGYNIQKHDTTNKYRFAIGAGSSLDATCVSDSAYTDTNWHYIVGVRRSGTNYLYVDGVQQAATSTQAITNSGANFDIGRQYTDATPRWWNGIIDEVRVSNTGRNASWIATSYNNQNSPSTFYSVGSPSTYDFVLKIKNNQVADAWKVSLKVYDSSNIARISSTTISFHDGISSDQIIVSNGIITQSEGALYDLAGSATIYISMSNVQAPSSGTSYVYVYLKVLKPSTSVYSLFIIAFEIT